MYRTIFALFFFSISAWSYNWSENEPLPTEGLSNPYSLSPTEITAANRQGRLHALNYPVSVTGAVLPYRPTLKMFDRYFGSIDNLGLLLGLHPYPVDEGSGPYFIPFPNGVRPQVRMGLSIVETPRGRGICFSCASCHSATLFGRQVIGLTNRFPKANKMFVDGKKGLALIDPHFFKAVTGATDEETEMFKSTKENLKFVEARRPRTLGLDTSLAHVALSLSRRGTDEWADMNPAQARSPRPEALRSDVGDSKPAPWWNVKYKNRWLLDGSVVSGNPIYTNLLWNEIGRGTNLKSLKNWFDANSAVISDLTTAVYQSEPPLIGDFFPAEKFDLSAAKKGETIFENRCSRCHGTYEKGWNLNQNLPITEQIKTFKVNYFSLTPVVDVGTDPHRYRAMKSLEQLNNLAISKEVGIKIVAQEGYVPPPLVGIWSRYPYFHNNSAPTLCDVISPAKLRPSSYIAREAISTSQDFDFECNGYPRAPITARDRSSDKYFDTHREGLSNMGHERMLIDENGREWMSADDKKNLVRYLQLL